jgi:SpoVK/Ycf46/Vps4 family AAA+-type ATPase
MENNQPNPLLVLRGFENLPKDSDRGAALLEIRQPDRFLADLILSEDQKNVLDSIILQFRSWDTLEANGLKPSHRILFCGPPGCGKTVCAEAMSGELGLPLLYVRFDAVVSSLLGETANNLRKVFDYASKGNWILFFDEFDAIGRSRDDVTEHGELKRVVNSFLQMLDRFDSNSLVIAATNFEQSLDPALWRRFDEIVRFDKPDKKQIQALLQLKLHGKFISKSLYPAAIKRLTGLSHADIERACLDLMRKSILEGKAALTEDDVDWALRKQEIRRQALESISMLGNPHVDKG